jgi:quinol monooxygenase YgiN
MFAALVYIHVKPEYVDAFIEATRENARNSLLEEGILRFDLIRQSDDPTRFILYEVYKSADDQAKHRETAHYLRWRDTVAPMMAEPRTGVRHDILYPDEADW